MELPVENRGLPPGVALAKRGLTGSLVSWALRAPLFFKILVANSLIVGVGAFSGTWLTQEVTGGRGLTLGLALFFTLVGVILSAAVNYAVLKTAFKPLSGLQQVASAVQAGKLEARAEPSPLADPQLEQLASTFNTMLDTLEERNRQLGRIAGQVIGAQEEERKRIARELHDQTAQALTTLLIRLKLLEKAGSVEKVQEELGQLRALVSSTMQDVRELSRSLRPILLDDLGLVPALESYLNSLGERTGEEIRFRVEGFEKVGRLPPLLELICYRVVQEAVTNALKYANAQSVRVSLVQTQRELLARVEDNGQGFNLLNQAGNSGLGLLGMRERAQLAGGKLQINSTPGEGTEIILKIPLLLPGLALPEIGKGTFGK